jgi:hypothetical protein
MFFLLLLLLVHLAASSEAAPSANSMSPSPNIDPPIVTYDGKSIHPPASDSAVLTLLSLGNLSVPVSWILEVEVDTHAYEGDRLAVIRRFYLGPQKSNFSNGIEALSGCALFFPSASQHYNSFADPAKPPTDTRLPKDCISNLTKLAHAAAPANITGFEKDATNTCNELAGEIVINPPTSCLGYDVRNVHPQSKYHILSGR